ncbi:MAG: hypothetical protein GAK31_00952 [Stenotrophomonas maltophilia]|uniref:Holin n=1 Tax=Stenotrophomonas maltophilia TaxID=40324 RepID=A0A7V8JNP1_STEMA|nr:MAG: hypothetical protein GAK31_00952 [Stenotrophomonas maltophilia]
MGHPKWTYSVSAESEIAMAAVGKNAAYAGGAAALIGGLSANDIAAFGGLLIAVVGVLVQIYFARKRNARDAELHQARMDEFRKAVQKDDR